MATRTKVKPKSKTSERLPVPAGVSGWLCAQQVCDAIGGCSRRKFQELRKSRVFPEPDRHLGRFPRWTSALVNAWCAGNPETMAEVGEGGDDGDR